MSDLWHPEGITFDDPIIATPLDSFVVDALRVGMQP